MPWRETCMEQERESFVLAVLGGEMAMSRLCAVWGISRSNGYKWLRRYQESGRAG
jgi:putative transposase